MAAFYRVRHFCRCNSEKLNMPDPEEVFVAALLHDLGKVIIKLELPEESSLIEQK